MRMGRLRSRSMDEPRKPDAIRRGPVPRIRRPADRQRHPDCPVQRHVAAHKRLHDQGGCIFYQGEANITDPTAYRMRFPAMVAEWRARWGAEFPFFYVQLAPYGYTNMGWSPDQTQAARFREVQQQCMSDIPRSGMVATTDIGAVHTIHPPDKKTVAKRLLYLAYARCYGYKGFECSGPIYKSMEIQGRNHRPLVRPCALRRQLLRRAARRIRDRRRRPDFPPSRSLA